MTHSTELVMILDRSGSMSGLEADTIGGFNSVISRQKQEEGKVLVSTVLFDNEIRVLHDRLPLEQVPVMTQKEYFVGGCTALLDAIGGAIHHIGNIHKYARAEDRPEKTLFIIITDGMENSSKRYTYDKVKAMIERQKARYGWEFTFLGANMDAIQVAGRMGIAPSEAVNISYEEDPFCDIYDLFSKRITEVRAGCCATAGSWKAEFEEKRERRSSRK